MVGLGVHQPRCLEDRFGMAACWCCRLAVAVASPRAAQPARPCCTFVRCLARGMLNRCMARGGLYVAFRGASCMARGMFYVACQRGHVWSGVGGRARCLERQVAHLRLQDAAGGLARLIRWAWLGNRCDDSLRRKAHADVACIIPAIALRIVQCYCALAAARAPARDIRHRAHGSLDVIDPRICIVEFLAHATVGPPYRRGTHARSHRHQSTHARAHTSRCTCAYDVMRGLRDDGDCARAAVRWCLLA